MPLQGSWLNMVKELMASYKKNGKIGNSRPKNKDEAHKQAMAIAFAEQRRKKANRQGVVS